MPKIVDHDDYRRELIEKCFHFVCRHGFANITMRELAREIGVSTGALYHYFHTKEKILEGMITWAGQKNLGEYMRRSSSSDSIKKRFDLLIEFLIENGEFYQNIMLLGIDMYRNIHTARLKKLYALFSSDYIDAISERLNISRQFSRSIFIYFLGLVFHSLSAPGKKVYEEQIKIFGRIIEPLIVDISENIEDAVSKSREIIMTLLMNHIPVLTK